MSHVYYSRYTYEEDITTCPRYPIIDTRWYPALQWYPMPAGEYRMVVITSLLSRHSLYIKYNHCENVFRIKYSL